ncbi:MAG TPA: glutamate mutase L [Pseudonocardiaceae bacterium]|nr:glutamate mutase L [Pseudonocardiaceae bacterium]
MDVGSTWTKAALVSPSGAVLATAQHPTTPPEVLDGIAAVTSAVHGERAQVLACSSAGGGLRLAVVGQERLVSAEAAYRVALSAGAKVVHVSSGDLDDVGVDALRDARPDVVLLAGGTDGGDTTVLLHNAHRLAIAEIDCPIVLAGNTAVREEASTLLLGTRRTVVVTDNVLPDIGEIAPGPARAAIRDVFLEHVIGGKGLSSGPRFRELVRAVTPEAVLTGVSRLAGLAASGEDAGAVLVVDVGGATTDVYSAVAGRPEREEHAVALPPDRRTVEGDIGVRWSAPGVIAEAIAEQLPADGLAEPAAMRAAHVDFVPDDDAESVVDARLATLAAILAVRRHLRLIEGRLGPAGASLLVLSGGVFRHTGRLDDIEAALRADPVLRPVLRRARAVVDGRYVLAPAGLLAVDHPDVADALLTGSGLSAG